MAGGALGGLIFYLLFFVSIIVGIIGIVFLFINEDRKKQGIKILKFAVPAFLLSIILFSVV